MRTESELEQRWYNARKFPKHSKMKKFYVVVKQKASPEVGSKPKESDDAVGWGRNTSMLNQMGWAANVLFIAEQSIPV